MAHSKARCGCKIYKGLEIPQDAIILHSKSGRECYLSAQGYLTLGKPMQALVRYIDTGEFVTVDWERVRGLIGMGEPEPPSVKPIPAKKPVKKESDNQYNLL